MGSRLIRDGMLESEAVLSLPAEGRWLYVAILLSADDLGLFEATPFKLSRAADLRRETVELMMKAMVDLDLVRLYQGPGMRTFGFIPKFGQRIRLRSLKHPMPPESIFHGDEDALNKIKHLASGNDSSSPTTVSTPRTTVSEVRPEAEAEAKEEAKTIEPPRGSTERKPARVRAAAAQLVSVDALVADGVNRQHAEDWLAVRKRKTAPLTPTAWEQTKAEAAKARIPVGEAVRIAASESWAGFKASWLTSARNAANGAVPAKNPDKVAAVAQLLGFATPGSQGEVFDA
jgi:hypothetical protein